MFKQHVFNTYFRKKVYLAQKNVYTNIAMRKKSSRNEIVGVFSSKEKYETKTCTQRVKTRLKKRKKRKEGN